MQLISIHRLLRNTCNWLARRMHSAGKSEHEVSEQNSILELLGLLEDRAYKTYNARLMASQRLASRHHAWNTSLVSASAATTIASIALLAHDRIYGPAGPTVLVCISVLTLIASLVTSGLDYSGRSRDIFLNYRRIQRLSAEVERAQRIPELQTFEYVQDANRRYDALLDESENHTEADYLRTLESIDARRAGQVEWPLNSKAGKASPGYGKSPSVRSERFLSSAPYISLAAPVGLLLPLIVWIARGG